MISTTLYSARRNLFNTSNISKIVAPSSYGTKKNLISDSLISMHQMRHLSDTKHLTKFNHKIDLNREKEILFNYNSLNLHQEQLNEFDKESFSQDSYIKDKLFRTKCNLQLIADMKCFNGFQKVFRHQSQELKCQMKFCLYVPSSVNIEKPNETKVPLLFFLAGTSGNEQHFTTLSGFQRYAEEHQIAVLCPDVSPRGPTVPDENAWFLGYGAGFYIDATRKSWRENYRMHSYIVHELFDVIRCYFKFVDMDRIGMSGYSMGGHGALLYSFNYPEKIKSASVMAPISNPCVSVWGQQILSEYIGTDRELWKSFDISELVKVKPRKDLTILVDQGSADDFYFELLTPKFVEACEVAGQPIEYNYHEDYGHTFHFISTIIGNHFTHHAKYLSK